MSEAMLTLQDMNLWKTIPMYAEKVDNLTTFGRRENIANMKNEKNKNHAFIFKKELRKTFTYYPWKK